MNKITVKAKISIDEIDFLMNRIAEIESCGEILITAPTGDGPGLTMVGDTLHLWLSTLKKFLEDTASTIQPGDWVISTGESERVDVRLVKEVIPQKEIDLGGGRTHVVHPRLELRAGSGTLSALASNYRKITDSDIQKHDIWLPECSNCSDTGCPHEAFDEDIREWRTILCECEAGDRRRGKR